MRIIVIWEKASILVRQHIRSQQNNWVGKSVSLRIGKRGEITPELRSGP